MSCLGDTIVLALFCIGALTDFFDGFLARKLSDKWVAIALSYD
jgi:phosphatidylglycerophosphate synthase